MRRVLLDQGVPKGIKNFLTDCLVETAYERGWSTLTNGQLLSAVEEANFDVFVTADQNLRYQQNLTGRSIAVVVLSTNIWPVIATLPIVVATAVNSVASGTVQLVNYPKPSRKHFTPEI